MKAFRLLAVGLFFAAIFAVSASAQVVNKVGIINTNLFEDEKAGISKYITGIKSLRDEFKKDSDELTALSTKIQGLERELKIIEEQLNSATPVNKEQLRANYNSKADEYGRLGREFKFKEDDAKVRYQRREQIVLGPILQDIGKAMQEFAKQNAYSLLLDAAKLYNTGVLLHHDDVTDVTVAFVKFYNSRPVRATTK